MPNGSFWKCAKATGVIPKVPDEDKYALFVES